MNKLPHTPAAPSLRQWFARGRIAVVTLLAVLWSTACGPTPTIDGSSQRRYVESKEEVRASLSAAEQGRYDNAIGLIEVGLTVEYATKQLGNLWQDAANALAGRPRQRSEAPKPREMLHGFTGRQVIAFADSITSARAGRAR